MAKAVVVNQTILSVRLTPQLAERVDAWWRLECVREAGVRNVSRNEAIAKLLHMGLEAAVANSRVDHE